MIAAFTMFSAAARRPEGTRCAAPQEPALSPAARVLIWICACAMSLCSSYALYKTFLAVWDSFPHAAALTLALLIGLCVAPLIGVAPPQGNGADKAQ